MDDSTCVVHRYKVIIFFCHNIKARSELIDNDDNDKLKSKYSVVITATIKVVGPHQFFGTIKSMFLLIKH